MHGKKYCLLCASLTAKALSLNSRFLPSLRHLLGLLARMADDLGFNALKARYLVGQANAFQPYYSARRPCCSLMSIDSQGVAGRHCDGAVGLSGASLGRASVHCAM